MQSVKTKNFEYGEREIQYLRSVDENLGKAIDKLGKIATLSDFIKIDY
ncbi:hypothetical protein [Clostridium folliculivorans]|uniref:Uncharacterized protein n=1 Tax=Clostridium folliculivorans TaxID=2886038 RepID=A0A9W5Y119_9CLOT|nr:hypothetical protein [Clostridium folliculivorans]GKU24638.1 hypothetical protein CFOLD11_14640 [Clostridium folliculivorans]GKU30736.1 hypothetical protein CFB3_28430 [Clostridium folliculivorans]